LSLARFRVMRARGQSPHSWVVGLLGVLGPDGEKSGPAREVVMGDIVAAVRQAAEAGQGQVSCVRAFQLARRMEVSPAEVGAAADALGVRISRCQLGLFGYGSKAEGRSKIVQATEDVPLALAAQLRGTRDEHGNLTCAAVWSVARKSRISRLRAAGAAQGMGLRVKDCQLGCFKPRPKTG
jgi:hypothetical protein